MSMHDMADWASVFTFVVTLLGAVVGIYGYARYRCQIRHKRIRLENYLREEKATSGDKGQRSILRIMGDVGLTQDEILQASFGNARIGRCVTQDEQGFAKLLLLEYVGPRLKA